MQIALVIPEYLMWHYTRAPKLSLNIISNFSWFTYNFFSIPIFKNNLFKPWTVESRNHYHPGRRLNSRQLFISALLNMLSVFAKVIMVSFGLFICGIIWLAGMAMFLVWLLLPVIVVTLLISAVNILF